MFKKIIAVILSATMLTGVSVAFAGCSNSEKGKAESSKTDSTTEETKSSVTDTKNTDSISTGAILQCFCWDFNTIKESMADIAAAGFTAVQTSPINECLEGEDGGMELYGNGKWYYHYQPTDFKIGNYQLGTRDEFKAMCDEADKYDIKVIVDVIANHTTPQLDAISQDLINAGGGSLDTLFHENNAMDLVNYADRLQCTTYKMGGLPDINTERTSFQDYFIKYINDCIECGADGFRYDTAKHIGLPDDPKEDDGFENNFWERVTTEVTNADKMFIYGEVLQGSGDRIEDYIDAIGRTTSSTYGGKIRSALTSGNLNVYSISDYWLGDAPLNMVTWVESHDNYINDKTWYDLSNDLVELGWAIITARKDGTPLFFSRPYNATFDNTWGMNRIGVQGDDFYKSDIVSAVNHFRTAMIGEDEELANPNDDSTALVVQRGKKGAVIVTTDCDIDVNFSINLADGTYIDRVDNETKYVVKNGVITCDESIEKGSVVVLYNDGYVENTPVAEVGVDDDTVFEYDSNSLKVKLTCDNTSNATYSIDGGEEKNFTDGQAITIKPNSDNITVVELRAENSEKVPTYEKLVFTHKNKYKVSKGTKVYFEKPEDGTWDDDLYLYAYDVDGNENASWPGLPMKMEDDGKYSYTFEEEWETPYIIFNDGSAVDSVQYPSGEGLEVEANKIYKVE